MISSAHFRTAAWLMIPVTRLAGQNLPAPAELGGEAETGAQIAWASEAFATNFMADGITTFEESGQPIHFEIGVFSPGFDPLTASAEDWVTHWIVLQGAEYDLVDQQVIQTATLTSNEGAFAAGTQTYIWGYTTKDLSQGAEWIILGAPEWKLPDSDAPLPTTFSVSDALQDDALWGFVNPIDGSFHMQLQIVPEPSSTILLLAGISIFTLRRGRQPWAGPQR